MKIKLFFYFILISSYVLGQNIDTIEVSIIGNPHENTSYYNSKILDSLLNRIKPDLILVEFDSSFFNENSFYDTIHHPSLLKETSPNTVGTINYKKRHKKIDIRPFDISGRNDSLQKHDYFTLKSKMYEEIFKTGAKGLLSPRNQRDFVLLAKSLYAINTLNIKSLRQLNSQFLANLMFLQQSVYLNSAINIVQTTDSLKKYENFANWQSEFWEKRNNVMVENILHFINTNNYKRIVVLTGNMHKFYLIYGLKKPKEYSVKYIIKEFWDY